MNALQFGQKLAMSMGAQQVPQPAPLVSPNVVLNPRGGPQLQALQQQPTLRPGNVLTGPDLRGIQAQNQQQKLV